MNKYDDQQKRLKYLPVVLDIIDGRDKDAKAKLNSIELCEIEDLTSESLRALPLKSAKHLNGEELFIELGVEYVR